MTPSLPTMGGASAGPPQAPQPLVQPPDLAQGSANGPAIQMDAFLNQIREMYTTIKTFAQQHPEAATDFEAAGEGLLAGMAKVAASMAAPEQVPQPPVV